MKQIRSISYGGGVQSTALIVLAVTGRIEADVALFSNVGDDSEHPNTLRYVREVAIPYAQQFNFPVVELTPVRRGEPTTIWKEITRPGSNRDMIPMYGEAGNPLTRACTIDFKIRTIHRWLRQHGASKSNPAVVMLGISTDEIERAGRSKDAALEVKTYPLLDLGLNRGDCEQIIRDAGLPVPPKSSCFFCPFHSELVWAEMRRDEPELFEKAQELEDCVQERKREASKRQVFITRRGARDRTRLEDTIACAGPTLFDSQIGIDGCDSGFCWT